MLRSVRLASITARRFNSSVIGSGGSRGNNKKGKTNTNVSANEKEIPIGDSNKMTDLISKIQALNEVANRSATPSEDANEKLEEKEEEQLPIEEDESPITENESSSSSSVEQREVDSYMTERENEERFAKDMYQFIMSNEGEDGPSSRERSKAIQWDSRNPSSVLVDKSNALVEQSSNIRNGSKNLSSRKDRFKLAENEFSDKNFSINEFLNFYEDGHIVSTDEDEFVKDLTDHFYKEGLSPESTRLALNDTYVEMIEAYSVRKDINTFKKIQALKKLGFDTPLLSSESSDNNTPFPIGEERIEELLKLGEEKKLSHEDTVLRIMSNDYLSTDKEESTYKLKDIPTKEKLDLISPKSAHTEKSRVLRALDQYLYKKSGAHLEDITDSESLNNTHFTKFKVWNNPDLTTSTQNYPYTSRTVSASTSVVSPQQVSIKEIETKDFDKVIESVVYGIRNEIPIPKRKEDNSNVGEIAFVNALNDNTQIKVDNLHLQLKKAIGSDGNVKFNELPESVTEATHEAYFEAKKQALAEFEAKRKSDAEERRKLLAQQESLE